MDPRQQFAANLRKARPRRKLSQEALGAAAGMHRTEVSRLERAERDPRLATIVKLARALDVPPSKLIDGIT